MHRIKHAAAVAAAQSLSVLYIYVACKVLDTSLSLPHGKDSGAVRTACLWLSACMTGLGPNSSVTDFHVLQSLFSTGKLSPHQLGSSWRRL